MKNTFLGICCFLLPCCLFAQETDKAPSTFAIALNQDAAFGFYPEVFGSLGMTKNFSLSFYGIFWTNPAYGNSNIAAGQFGTDFWLETGFGGSWALADGRVIVNPSVGFTYGKLLSGGARGVIGDGIVPNLAMFYFGDRFELEFFAAYYKSMRKEGPITSDLLLAWVYPGVFLTKNFSMGAQYEHFVLTRITGGGAGHYYHNLGAYLKVTLNKGIAFRISGGYNFVDPAIGGYSREFYKLFVYFPIL